MQKYSSNLFKSIAFYLLYSLGSTAGAINLEHADSLFASHKYTEAFIIYDSIYSKAELESPSMLLKMAFIKEGLDDYVNAIFYLNKYYDKTHDAQVIDQIRSLAEAHQLKGYEYGDLQFLEKQMSTIKPIARWSLLILSLISAGYLLISKFKYKKISAKAFIFTMVFSVLGIVFSLAGNWQKRGILEKESLAFDAPSAGANVVTTLNKGDQVDIIDDMDIWLLVKHAGKDLYVKKNLIKEI